MKFPTQFDKFDRVFSRAGSRKKVLYDPQFVDGELTLVSSGEADLYDEIQSHKDSVDIHVLLKRYQEGDTLALERAQSFYGDISQVPRSYSGLLNAMLQSRSVFDSLPAEVRASFDHSFEKFISSMDSPDFFSKLVQNGATAAPVSTTNEEGSAE